MPRTIIGFILAAFAWLASDTATVILGIFAVVELIADKVPAVDHALHAVSFAARPLAGAILVGGTIHTDNAGTLYTLMALGAVNSLIVHSSSAAARTASTATTFALANAPISAGEDATAIFGIVLAFLHPYIAAILAALFVLTLIIVVVVIAAVRSGSRSARRSPGAR